MCREVVGHPQAGGQVQHPQGMANQVVVVDVVHPDLAQRQHQCVVLGVNGERSLQALGRAQLLQQHLAALVGHQGEKHGVALQVRGQLGHMPQCATRAVMQHGQHDRGAGLAQARQVHHLAGAAGRVHADEGMDLAFVVGVHAAQGFHGRLFARALARLETHAAGVAHEGVEQVQVAPAGFGGTLAEVVFLAVALAEALDIEQAHGGQRVAPDVHAKAHTSGYVHCLPGVGLGEQFVEPGGIKAVWQRVVLAEVGVAADGGVVGEGGDRRHPGVRPGAAHHAVEPVVGHFGIAVEQDDVVGVAQGHAAVDGAHEAEVFLVFQQHQARVLGGLLAQPCGDGRLRTGVVDGDQPECCPVLRCIGQHGFDAAAGVFQAAVHRHNDVHRVRRGLQRCGRSRWGGWL